MVSSDTTPPMYDSACSTKLLHKFSRLTNAIPASQTQLNSYMRALNGGGDPVTALGVRGVPPALSVLQRQAGVQQNMEDNLITYQTGSTTGTQTVAR
ncbi:hypothetical protein F4825DRAFT_403526, partial [Nemania diffusa]